MRAAGRLAGHSEDLALASDPRATGEALDRLARDRFGKIGYRHYDDTKEAREFVEVLEALTINPNISSATTEFVIEAVEDSEKLNRVLARSLGKNPARLIGRLDNPELSERVDMLVALFTEDPDDLRELAFHQSEGVRYNVACNGETPHDLLLALARDPEESVQERMVFSDDSEIHKALATSTFLSIRMEVAERTTFPEVLDLLGDDSDYEVVYLVEQNKHTWKKTKNRIESRYPQGTLEAEESDLEIASNPRTTADKLEELSTSRDREVRLAVAENPQAEAMTLFAMLGWNDKDKELVNLVGKNPGRLFRRITLDEAQKRIDELLAQKATDPEVLRELFGVGGVFGVGGDWILEDLANNRHTPVDVLEAILKQGDPDLGYRVAQFVDKLTPVGKRLIVDHPDLGVRERAVDKSEDPDFIHELVVAEKRKEPRREVFVWKAMDNRRKSKETRDFLVAWSKEIDDALPGRTPATRRSLARLLWSAERHPGPGHPGRA